MNMWQNLSQLFQLSQRDQMKKFHDLFDQLDEEQLSTLASLLDSIAYAGELGPRVAAYYCGLSNAKLQSRFDRDLFGALFSDEDIQDLYEQEAQRDDGE